MGEPGNGSVNNKRLHIRVSGEVTVHLCENSYVAPVTKPLI